MHDSVTCCLLALFIGTLYLLCSSQEHQGLCTAVKVHFIAHTHDDVGWLKTPAQYYYGWNNTIQHASVRLIYNSVLDALKTDPTRGRRFTVVEMAFFSKWFYELSAADQAIVRAMVDDGMIEFAGGGWVSHDEATTYYVDILNQVELGHRFIAREFGHRTLPQVQWQVDPFGHSAGQVMLLSQSAGVMALFFSRIDYQDFSIRQQEQTREFFWAPSSSLGSKAVVFASMMLHGSYCPPIDFNFDILLNEPNVVSQRCSGDVAAHDTASLCADAPDAATDWAIRTAQMIDSDLAVSGGNDVMWTMGCDFTYMQARTWFENMDRIADLMSTSEDTAATVGLADTNVLYSTPQTYALSRLQEIGSQADVKRKSNKKSSRIKRDDFLPYADGSHMFWTGFYSSRPSFKLLVRGASAWLGGIQQIRLAMCWWSWRQNDTAALVIETRWLEEAIAQAQHHDAITGTAKQHVSFDYTKSLAVAMENVSLQLSQAVTMDSNRSGVYSWCFQSNESICPATNQSAKVFHILGWNTYSGHHDELMFEVPVYSSWGWQAASATFGIDAFVTVVPSTPSVASKKDSMSWAPYTAIVFVQGVASLSGFELTFSSSEQPKSSDQLRSGCVTTIGSGVGVSIVETKSVQLTFNSTSGRLLSMVNKVDNTHQNVSLEWCYYVSSTGDNASSQSSGAYIFRPKTGTCKTVWDGLTSQPAPLRVTSDSSQLVVLDQQLTEWLSIRWYVYGDSAHVDVDFTVTELPIVSKDDVNASQEGRELVMRWVTSIENGDEWWTDSNGLEMVKRKRNHRSFSPFYQTEPIAGNYYPVTSAALIRDVTSDWVVATDRTVGCSSISQGELECMVHRRILVDDGRGVGEPLNETDHITPYLNCEWSKDCGRHFGTPMPMRGRHRVVLQAPSNDTWRRITEHLYHKPLIMFGGGAFNATASPFAQWWSSSEWFNASTIPSDVVVVSVDVLPTTPVLCNTSSECFAARIRFAHMASCFNFSHCAAKQSTVNFSCLFSESPTMVTRTLLTSSKGWTNTSLAQIVSEASEDAEELLSMQRPSGYLSREPAASSWVAVLYPMEVHAYDIVWINAPMTNN